MNRIQTGNHLFNLPVYSRFIVNQHGIVIVHLLESVPVGPGFSGVLFIFFKPLFKRLLLGGQIGVCVSELIDQNDGAINLRMQSVNPFTYLDIRLDFGVHFVS
jgi:hypothetical protein